VHYSKGVRQLALLLRTAGFCLAECLGVLLASLDATLQPLLRDMKPTQLQVGP